MCNVIPVFESPARVLKKDGLDQNSKCRDVAYKVYTPKMKSLTFCVDCTVEMLHLYNLCMNTFMWHVNWFYIVLKMEKKMQLEITNGIRNTHTTKQL